MLGLSAGLLMDPLTIAAASGMRARLETLDLLANNIANQSTPGFKADREFYNLYVSAAAIDPWAQPATILPLVERRWTDFRQGTLVATGNPMDLALVGFGFFVLEGTDSRLYTRNGHFQLDRDGYLVSESGYRVLDREGRPIQLDPRQPLEVSPSGEIRQQGVMVAELAIVEFADPQQLIKVPGASFVAVSGVEPVPARQASVRQGYLEAANFSVAEAAVRLVEVLRQFEALNRALQLGHEMNRKVTDEVARPNP